MSKRLLALIITALCIGGIVWLFSSNVGANILWNISDSGTWLLPLVVVSSLIDAINPCAFSVLLLTITFLFSIGKLRTKVLKIGGVYIAGIFIAYILIGLGILNAFHLFNVPGVMGKVGAVLIVVLGILNILNDRFPSFPIRLQLPSVSHNRIARLMEKATVPTALLLGLLVGLCEFPCTGGPYLMVIGMLHDSATYLAGLGYLILYNVLFVLPLIIVLLITGDKTVVTKVQTWRRSHLHNSRLISGVVMILIGLIIWML